MYSSCQGSFAEAEERDRRVPRMLLELFACLVGCTTGRLVRALVAFPLLLRHALPQTFAGGARVVLKICGPSSSAGSAVSPKRVAGRGRDRSMPPMLLCKRVSVTKRCRRKPARPASMKHEALFPQSVTCHTCGLIGIADSCASRHPFIASPRFGELRQVTRVPCLKTVTKMAPCTHP